MDTIKFASIVYGLPTKNSKTSQMIVLVVCMYICLYFYRTIIGVFCYLWSDEERKRLTLKESWSSKCLLFSKNSQIVLILLWNTQTEEIHYTSSAAEGKWRKGACLLPGFSYMVLNKVEKGLMVLLFGLVFSVAHVVEIFLPTPLST